MVNAGLLSILNGFLELALLAVVAVYTGLVLTNYGTAGRHVHPRVDWRDPLHSAGRLAVWLGVVALALAVRIMTPIFEMLSEASAEVGEWFVGPRHHESR